MPSAASLGPRIRTNIPAKQSYDALQVASSEIAKSQLRISTGRRINLASDDVSGYITSRSLISRNSSLKTSVISSGEAINVTAIAQDSLDNIQDLLKEIRSSALLASSDTLASTERVALAKAGYRLAQQIDFIVDSTVFGGKQLLHGDFTADWTVGLTGSYNFLEVALDLSSTSNSIKVDSENFNLNSTTSSIDISGEDTPIFAGVTGLSLTRLNDVTESDLGIFAQDEIDSFIAGLGEAIKNVSIAASYVGGIQQRMRVQNDTLLSQISNYEAAISRLDDADVANEQLNLIKNLFLQETSIIGIAQSNANYLDYFRLLV